VYEAPMIEARRGRRKQLLLYLLSIVLPSALLIAFTLRLISQDRELVQKRLTEERQLRALEIGRTLISILDEARVRAVGAFGGAPDQAASRPLEQSLVLIGELRESRLRLPWESFPDSDRSQTGLRDPKFMEKLAQAEKAEFAGQSPAQAAGLYQALVRSAADPAQAALARLSLARVLYKMGRAEDGRKIDRGLLAVPAEIQDEHRIPFAVYAAEQLSASSPDHRAVVEALDPSVFQWNRLAPGAGIHGRNVILKIEKTAEDPDIRKRASRSRVFLLGLIETQAQALSLQKDIPSLDLKDSMAWTLYGRNPWLLGIGAIPGGQRILIACDAATSLKQAWDKLPDRAIPFADMRISGLQDPAGLPLGRALPNTRLVLPKTPAGTSAVSADSRAMLSLLIVGLALALAVFGSYLFWKNIRRDLITAEMRSQFVASVSHELKTPLASIRMYAETLQLGRLREQEKSENYLGIIVNESQRLDRLLTNVLDFSTIEQGRRIYRFEATSIPGVLEAAARAMDYPLRQKGFHLHLSCDEGVPPARADRDALLQAVLNLLDNAMKYSGEAREIDLILEKRDAAAAIRVRDRGIGIPESEHTRIFEKFYRVADPRNDGVMGTGLGLALAAHIAEAHGGRIEVQSAPGAGSTFSIILPLEIRP